MCVHEGVSHVTGGVKKTISVLSVFKALMQPSNPDSRFPSHHDTLVYTD